MGDETGVALLDARAGDGGFLSSLAADRQWGISWLIEQPASDMCLEAVCLALFTALAVFAGVLLVQTLQQTSSKEPVEEGTAGQTVQPMIGEGLRFRKCLTIWLCVAAVGRMHALVIVWVLRGHLLWTTEIKHNAKQIQCLGDFVLVAPDLLFLSAYSVIVCSWAKIHLTARMIYIPILVMIFVTLNVVAYVAVFLEAAAAILLHRFDQFWVCLASSVGVLHVMVVIPFIYYGIMVVQELWEITTKKFPDRCILQRVAALSALCCIAILARGLTYLGWACTETHPPFTTLLLLALVGDWLPAAVILVLLSPFTAMAWLEKDLAEESASDSPLICNEQQILPARSGEEAARLTWTQLYPTPNSSEH